MNLTQELEIALIAAREAGDAIMQIYQKDYSVAYKDQDPKSPVTDADFLANKIILKYLSRFEDYGILSEETQDNESRLSKKRVWIVDPLDGTSDFIQKTDEFTIMIGLVEEGESILGVVFQPATDTMYYAIKGEGAYKQIGNGQKERIRVSNIEDIKDARMLISRNHFLESDQEFIDKHGIRNTIKCGSAGLKICLIAEGKAEIYINSSNKTSEWDICGADVILTEAGGRLVDGKRNRVKYNKKNTVNEIGFEVMSFDFL